ncbi:hypothetical protein M9458_045454, partial [Cirrhinus mrigala]
TGNLSTPVKRRGHPGYSGTDLTRPGYYLKFLPRYSNTTAPLRQLLRKDEPWLWTQECTEAVHNLKAQLTSPPILSHFSTSCKTMVTCDASAMAIGAVLSQEQNGVERPIAFTSRALSPTEQRYSVGEREALACVWSCERWHLYLYGRPFTLRTDQHALVALLATSGTGHRPLRLHRWYDRLRQYNYKLQFTPGRENVVADLLSRSVLVQGTTDDVNHPETDIIQLTHTSHTPLQSIVSLHELKTASEQDPILSQLRTYIREGLPAQVSGELSAFARVKDELSCWNDTCVARGLCTVIPEPLCARVLKMAHEGHLGIVKLKQRCRERVWWPGINSEIELLVKDCPACLVSGKMGNRRPPLFQPLTWPTHPWQHLQLDICGEIHGVPHNQRYLVVAYDLHSKWPELTTTGSVTSQIIVDFLDSLFARWGLPQTITTDNGPQFVSADFSSYLRSKGIQQIHTTLYHPQANGGVERFHQSLKNGLRAHLAQGCTFNQAICLTLLHYRASQHSTTGVSPASLMLGRELNLPLDRLRPITPQRLPRGVKTRIARQQRRMKQRFDRLRRAKEPNIAVHDWVRARRPHRHNKLASFWSEPLVVTRQMGRASYLLEDGTRWHASRLKKVAAPASARPQSSEDLPYTFPSPEQGIATPQADRQNAQSLPQTPVLPAPPIISQAPRILCPQGRYLKDFVATFHV